MISTTRPIETETKQLITLWDEIYTDFNREFDVNVFEEDAADEWPLIYLLDKMKGDKNRFNNIVEFFLTHYSCAWHNNISGIGVDVEEESPEWYEGFDEYKRLILQLANYFQNERIKELLEKLTNNKTIMNFKDHGKCF